MSGAGPEPASAPGVGEHEAGRTGGPPLRPPAGQLVGGSPRLAEEGSPHLPFLPGALVPGVRAVWETSHRPTGHRGPWGGVSQGTPSVLSGLVGRYRCFWVSRK